MRAVTDTERRIAMRFPRLLLIPLLALSLAWGIRPAFAADTITVTLQAAPLTLGVGETVLLNGTGFNPRERVGFWATAPDGAVLGGRYVRSNGNGDISFDFQVPAEALGGRWAMTAYGQDSATPAIATFDVVGRPAQSANLIAAASPQSGPRGGTVRFTATGFFEQEVISYWFTGPDGKVYNAVSQEEHANNDGRVDISWNVPANVPKGRWVVTIQGILSVVSRGIVFELT